MLSSEKSGLHARQRQHRRQQSTPNAFQGVNVPSLPNNRQPAGHHRRGQSLDIRRRQQTTNQTARQAMVSTNTNNPGLANHPQHVLREAQQQRLQARPGTEQYYANIAPSGSENYLISPHASQFDPSYFDPNVLALNPYAGGLMMMQRGQVEYGDNMTDCRDSGLFNSDSALSTPTYSTFPDSPVKQGWSSEDETSSTGTLRRVSRGIAGRVQKFEKMGADGFPRPITPPNQNVQGYFPPTPVDTPHNRYPKIEPATRSRFQDGHDESMEITLKPVRSRAKPRAEDVFEDMKQQIDAFSPPKTNPLPNTETFTTLHMHMDNMNDGFMRLEPDLARCQSEPNGLEVSSQRSQHASPNASAQMPQFMSSPDDNCGSANYQMHPSTSTNSSRRGSPHRRTDSVASMMSAASIAGLDIEATKTETGISLEQINKYMNGPDPEDGKWKCLYEDCGKKFGRKENIKSHIQTHLGDRQYQCPECQKPFVRQHDLKRHAKIHSGYKPYECRCGNSFARQDALTRHKQRGMCIGGVAGVVRKNNRRGRPPKNSRPDMQTRQEKSAKTRQKNMSISSMSDFSDSSHANSPENSYDDIFDDLNMSSVNSQMQNMEMPSTAPMVPFSSGTSTTSHVVMSSSSPVNELVSTGVGMERMSSQESFASDFNTPPGLSQSASPQSAFWSDPPNVSGSSDPLSNMAVPSELLHDDDDDEDFMTRFTNQDNTMALDSNEVKFETEYTPFDVNNLTLFGDDPYMGQM